MATVPKNFRIKNGLIVEGTTGTIDGQNILTETGSDQYILDLIGGETLVKSVSGNLSVDNAGDLSIDTEGLFDTLVSDGLATSSSVTTALGDYTTTSNLDTTVGGYGYLKNADLPTMYGDSDVDNHLYGSGVVDYSNGQITVGIKSNAGIEDSNGELAINRTTVDQWYDAAGSASAADTSARGYADSLASNYDAAGAASTAETNANNYTNTALEDYTPTSSLDSTVDGYGYLKSADLSGYATESYVGTAIDNLVDGAPGLLDTLNEIAAAIADDENYATTMTTALSGKQNSLTAGSNIDITSDTISVTGLDAADISDFNTAALSATSAAYDAAGSASAAQTAAEGHADDLADNILDGTSAFSAVNISDVAKEVAAEATIATIGSANAITWLASEYGTAKALVKFKTATHSQVSEILLTLDGSGNIAITDYAETGTNGSLGTITAVNTAGTVAISVTTVYANTDVSVKATLIK